MATKSRMATGSVETRHGRVFYQEAGNGPPLILLHATPKSSRSYKTLMPLLAQQHRVIAPDTLGFGESDPLPSGVSMPTLAESMADLLDGLNAAPSSVFGLHTGNKIGTALTVNHSERVSCFILCGMTHSIILDRAERETAIKSLVATPFTRIDISEDEKRDRAQGEASVYAMYGANYGFDLTYALSRLVQPTLVLELATPLEDHYGRQANAVAALIPKGEALTFEGSDRDALEKRPEELAAAILSFTQHHQGSSDPSK